MIPVKTFTFFKNETRTNVNSLSTSFPYKGDLYIHISGNIGNNSNVGIWGEKNGEKINIQAVSLTDGLFTIAFALKQSGVYQVIGAEAFDSIYASISSTGDPGNVTVVGKFVFAG